MKPTNLWTDRGPPKGISAQTSADHDLSMGLINCASTLGANELQPIPQAP